MVNNPWKLKEQEETAGWTIPFRKYLFFFFFFMDNKQNICSLLAVEHYKLTAEDIIALLKRRFHSVKNSARQTQQETTEHKNALR